MVYRTLNMYVIVPGERFAWLLTKNAIAHILSEYEVRTSEETPDKLKFFRQGFLLLPTEGVPLKFNKIV